ncbi:hypothetical protein ACS0TY_010345 [Phlomoides rotata]
MERNRGPSNFPENCSVKTLWNKFLEVGKVVDLFCPKKRDKSGKLFGFVRFVGGQMLDSKTFLLKLNSFWVESYKLRVFVPKYERNSSKVIMKPPVSWPVKETNRVTEKSFLEVFAKPKDDNIYVRKTSQNSFSFSSTEEDKEWLKNCWMASLRKEFE